MKTIKILLVALLAVVSIGAQPSFARDREVFSVQSSVKGTYFIINNNKFTARGYCSGIKRGDAVVFTEGSPSGICISSVFINLRTGKECSVWCH